VIEDIQLLEGAGHEAECRSAVTAILPRPMAAGVDVIEANPVAMYGES